LLGRRVNAAASQKHSAGPRSLLLKGAGVSASDQKAAESALGWRERLRSGSGSDPEFAPGASRPESVGPTKVRNGSFLRIGVGPQTGRSHRPLVGWGANAQERPLADL